MSDPSPTPMLIRLTKIIGDHYNGYVDPKATPNTWASAMDVAQAVLKSLREPEATLRQFAKEHGANDGAYPDAGEVTELWQAAIDALLTGRGRNDR